MRRTIIASAVWACPAFGLGACGGQVVIGGALPDSGGVDVGEQQRNMEAGAPQLAGGNATDAENAVSPGANGEGGVALTITMQGSPVLRTDPYSLSPGQEVVLCQTFSNPFGNDVDLVWFESVALAASDVFLFSLPPTGGVSPTPTALTACAPDPLGSRPFLFFSDQPEQTWTWPQNNMGYPLSAANSLMLRVHYLNTANMLLSTQTTMSIDSAQGPGRVPVTTRVGTIFLSHAGFPVSAVSDGAPLTDETSSIPLTQGYSIFGSWNFAQPQKAQVSASGNGSVFYHVTNSGTYSQISYESPPVPFGVGESITWNCTYPLGNPATNGKCVYQGYYYPADPQNPDRSLFY